MLEVRYKAVSAMMFLWACLHSAYAHEEHTVIEELVVYGRSKELVGTAESASEGTVGYDDIQMAPLLRVGELVESVPGMVATQHSGSGKANQYFLRGFNLDHGTDFSGWAEGVPLNMRTHGHGQGYLDLNFLIPELVEKTSHRKGPYAASEGDFSSAGSIEFVFYERLEEGLVRGTVGENAYYRGLVAGSSDLGRGVVTGAVDAMTYDGPWSLDENLRQHKVFLSYGSGRAKLTLQGYDGSWDSTDQIPLRAVQSGLIDEFGFIDPDLGGDTKRYALTGSLDFGSWDASAYILAYDFTLFSNFTYFLDDPLLGDEFEQRDERTVYGGRLGGAIEGSLAGRPATYSWGGELRYDDIKELGLYGTAARVRTGVVRRDSVEERSLGVFGQAAIGLTDRSRAVLGLRADYYDWEVDALRPDNSGDGDDALLSPKLSLAYRVSRNIEGYLNWGRGFHSNDVRGTTITMDPLTGEAVEPVEALVRSEGAEIGLRFEHGRRFNATLVGFLLELDSELVFVGDAGATEPNSATERVGLEAAAFWQPIDWLAFDAAYTVTDAEFEIDRGAGKEIPGAVESTFSLGLRAAWPNGFGASARLRYLGEAPLVEDGSVTAEDSVLVNVGAFYRRDHLEFNLEVFNLLDSKDNDISYFYASRLPGEPVAGAADLHFHPLEPRTIRASVTKYW